MEKVGETWKNIIKSDMGCVSCDAYILTNPLCDTQKDYWIAAFDQIAFSTLPLFNKFRTDLWASLT